MESGFFLKWRPNLLSECKWKADDDGIYQTECGDAFVFDSGTPKENKFNFCCFCGKKLADVTEYESFSMGVSLPVESKGSRAGEERLYEVRLL